VEAEDETVASDVERAVSALEEAVGEVLSLLKAASYGLRLAVRRVGDVATTSPALSEATPQSAAEMERLVKALELGEDHLSDVTVLALGDHFRAFLARALDLPQLPPLPLVPAELEALAGTPGALAKTPFWFRLALQLYRAALQGGRIDRETLEALGLRELEIAYPGGKIKLYQEGSRVTLTEHQLEETAQAFLDAARAIRLRLLTV
jgi:hypothetical protein